MQSIYISADNVVQLSDTRRSDTGALVSDATVSAQLKDEDLVAVGSAITMAAVGSVGLYQGTAPSTLALTHGLKYYIDITLSGTLVGFRRIPVRAAYHGEAP